MFISYEQREITLILPRLKLGTKKTRNSNGVNVWAGKKNCSAKKPLFGG